MNKKYLGYAAIAGIGILVVMASRKPKEEVTLNTAEEAIKAGEAFLPKQEFSPIPTEETEVKGTFRPYMIKRISLIRK